MTFNHCDLSDPTHEFKNVIISLEQKCWNAISECIGLIIIFDDTMRGNRLESVVLYFFDRDIYYSLDFPDTNLMR